MRRDFILPVLLLVGLLAMGLYATTADRENESRDDATITATPVACEGGRLIGRIGVLPEASGLTASRQFRDLFWSHNDSSDPVLYAIAADGSIKGHVQLAAASVTDWEAISASTCHEGNCLYIGDIGDNERRRRTITIYRAREPAPSERSTARATRIEAAYPEGPQDAEAMFVAKGTLFVVTKGEDAPIRLYRLPDTPAETPVRLEFVAMLSDTDPRKNARITDAAVSPSGRWVALRSNDVLLFYQTDALVAGNPGTPLMYELGDLDEPQGEGLAWADDRTLYLAGEASGGGTFARISCALPR